MKILLFLLITTLTFVDVNCQGGNATQIQEQTDPLSLCGSWTQLGVKCYKIIESLTTKNQAKERCKQEDPSAYVVQIRTEEEQVNVFNMINSYRGKHLPILSNPGEIRVREPLRAVSSVWLGVNYGCISNYGCGRYYWEDKGERLTYTNWDENSPDTSGSTNLCVQMDLKTAQWSDVKCGRKNLIVCEKSNELTMDNLYNALKSAYQNLLGQVNQLKEVSNSVPIGFIYTQLPNQSSPLDIWPTMNWTDITDEYSGLFFRAEGNGSLPFGETQQQNYSRISHITGHGIEMNNTDTNNYDNKFVLYEFQVKQNDWTMVNATNKQLYGVSFYETKSDNIPINTAIKLWKRTG